MEQAHNLVPCSSVRGRGQRAHRSDASCLMSLGSNTDPHRCVMSEIMLAGGVSYVPCRHASHYRYCDVTCVCIFFYFTSLLFLYIN
jgi:hypothetical protein